MFFLSQCIHEVEFEATCSLLHIYQVEVAVDLVLAGPWLGWAEGEDGAGSRAGVGTALLLPVLVLPGTPGYHLTESQFQGCLPGERG